MVIVRVRTTEQQNYRAFIQQCASGDTGICRNKARTHMVKAQKHSGRKATRLFHACVWVLIHRIHQILVSLGELLNAVLVELMFSISRIYQNYFGAQSSFIIN